MLKRILVAAFLCAAMLAPAGAAERIMRFISDVDVQRNGDLIVTESIQVQAEGRARSGTASCAISPPPIPAMTARASRSASTCSRCRATAQAENYVTEQMTNGVRVRIGNAGTTLNHGLHEYVIKYRTTRQIGFFDNFDELYWNATGTGWTFPIDFAEARITLPERVEFKQTALYTGPQGARGKDARIVEQRPAVSCSAPPRGCRLHNGLTVAAGWPKGVMAPPTQIAETRRRCCRTIQARNMPCWAARW